jgi:hypothetical protein
VGEGRVGLEGRVGRGTLGAGRGVDRGWWCWECSCGLGGTMGTLSCGMIRYIYIYIYIYDLINKLLNDEIKCRIIEDDLKKKILN